jgi:hypothetical protein
MHVCTCICEKISSILFNQFSKFFLKLKTSVLVVVVAVTIRTKFIADSPSFSQTLCCTHPPPTLDTQ